MNAAIEHAVRCAKWYRQRGYNPLPSRAGGRGPVIPYAEFWETVLPWDLYEANATKDIQIMCGQPWPLIVLDCDGDKSIYALERLEDIYGELPETWTVQTPGPGYHYWFQPPEGELVSSGRIWGLWDTAGKGSWTDHCGLEILGQRHPVTVPPSVGKNGVAYRWYPGSCPRSIAAPALAPRWLLDMPRLTTLVNPHRAPGGRTVKPTLIKKTALSGKNCDRHQVIAAILEAKAMRGVAEAFGVVFASDFEDAKGWVKCHAVTARGRSGRDSGDVHPSAWFNVQNGCYTEFYPEWGRNPISLFDLGALVGRYATWQDACNDLGATYLSR